MNTNEGQQQFTVAAIITSGPDLSIQCTRCYRWTVHIDRPLSLADLNQRAAEHAEVCR